ncbi:MAG TPA: DUF1648 domain-containing protein [Chloroflexi bacterium]|nr:DUF1648 domain-containing protein [Chloroflexota bacterium]
MTKWNTNKKQGLIVGIAAMIVILVIDGLIIWLATVRALTIGTFIISIAVLSSLALLSILGYWLHGLFHSEYLLDRNTLIIHWGAVEQVIPCSQIERVFTGDDIEKGIQFSGGNWPGHWVGYGHVPDVGATLFYATVPPRQQIYVVTPGLTYGISPLEADEFLQSLRQRLEMGPTQVVEPSSQRPAFLDWDFWQDRLAVGFLGASILALLLLVGLLCFQFPSLPWMVPLHFDARGIPDRLDLKGKIFIIPLIGFLALLVNAGLGIFSYQRERMISYLLWGGALLVQILVWTAALGILGRV